MKRTIQIIALLAFSTITIMAQETIDRKTVVEKYDEVSRLETRQERREFFGRQSEEMRVVLWLENIDRKTKGVELSAEQKEILDVIKKKFITVEFAQSVKGKSEADAGQEYNELMGKASQLLGKDNLREWFGILGDSSTLKKK
jgi:hypothetical protein